MDLGSILVLPTEDSGVLLLKGELMHTEVAESADPLGRRVLMGPNGDLSLFWRPKMPFE